MTRRTDAFGSSVWGFSSGPLAALRSPKNRLGREVVIVLMIKLTIIGLAAAFIFGPNQRPRIDAAKVAAHLVGAPVAPPATAVSNSAASRSEIP